MRPIRTALLAATMAATAYAGFSFCVLGATGIGAQYCGDGVVQEKYEYCGDGVVQSGEECDVGTVNGDVCTATYGGGCTYCSSDCKRADVMGPKCGDGIVNDNEACDDANKVDTDECNNRCEVTFCGDNVVQTGESCDNGNSNGVVCTPGSGTCTYCSASCDIKTIVGPRCGDGKVDAGEACDDANTDNTDACNNRCEVTYCGDGAVQTGESCDDGSRNGTVCVPGSGQTCSYCSSTCSKVSIQGAACGNGKVEAGEKCDDGNTKGGDGCSSACLIEPSLLLDTGAGIAPVSKPTNTTVSFGGEAVTLPSFLPNTGGPEKTFRWVELN